MILFSIPIPICSKVLQRYPLGILLNGIKGTEAQAANNQVSDALNSGDV